MSDPIDVAEVAAFIESNQGQTRIASKELEDALRAGNLESVLAASPYEWHKHSPPICASGHVDPSCAGRGPHALCTFGFSAGGCDCAHWPTT